MIIKNCPAFMANQNNCIWIKSKFSDCEKNQCIMKQIVSALKEKTLEANDKILNILEVE